MYVIECLNHNHERWDVRTQKDAKQRLFLYGGNGFALSPDVLWLQSVAREQSGTWFTAAQEKAARYNTEEEADERLASLVLEMGYLPGDLATVKIESPKEENA